ncbi:MAG TPA: hypothetical protein VMA86_06620, partial [Acetobacteraceae bacterium]|nr:hypothetical protein [Acetobacteraceae bacterium]
MARPKKIDHPVRKMMSLSPKLAKAVSDYRFEHRIKTESEAIRHLIDGGRPLSLPALRAALGGPARWRSP